MSELSIEQRVADALADLESLLVEGQPVESAIIDAAKANEIKPLVLRKRADEQFGDLATVGSRARVSISAARRTADLKVATTEYCRIFYGPEPRPPFVEFEVWMKTKFAPPPDAVEMESANTLRMELWNHSMFRDLYELLHHAKKK